MGFTPRKRALGYLLFGIYVILRAKAVKTHLQVKVRISLQCKQAFNILKETSGLLSKRAGAGIRIGVPEEAV